jgi:hypothetical protein
VAAGALKIDLQLYTNAKLKGPEALAAYLALPVDARLGQEQEESMEKARGDVVVTVPKSFGLAAWIAEGDAAGEPWSGQEWDFYLGGNLPNMAPGDRVYVVYNGKLRGYAPLVRIAVHGEHSFSLVRHGGAVAVTIPEFIRGFRGWRYRWWDRIVETPFPDWQEYGTSMPTPVVTPPERPVFGAAYPTTPADTGFRGFACSRGANRWRKT